MIVSLNWFSTQAGGGYLFIYAIKCQIGNPVYENKSEQNQGVLFYQNIDLTSVTLQKNITDHRKKSNSGTLGNGLWAKWGFKKMLFWRFYLIKTLVGA